MAGSSGQKAVKTSARENERTLLLPKPTPAAEDESPRPIDASEASTTGQDDTAASPGRWMQPIHRVWSIAFFTQIIFGLSQTSLIFTLQTMTCEAYYKTHSGHTLDGVDRCHIGPVERAAAHAVALNSGINGLSVMVNLFLTTRWIQQRGVKSTYFRVNATLAFRQCLQLYGVILGGGTGVLVIQITQLLVALGSAGGYQLIVQSYVASLAAADERTSRLGQLSGIQMAGAAIGYPLGGWLYTSVHPYAPWIAPICAFPLLFLLGVFMLPYIAPERLTNTSLPNSSNKPSPRGGGAFFGPLKIFVPRKMEEGGRSWNLTLLGAGAALSVLATGYQPTGIQLFGTNKFGWKPINSGFMLSGMLMIRAVFLTVLFPRIIKYGRLRMARRSTPPPTTTTTQYASTSDVEQPLLHRSPPPDSQSSGKQFDLVFLRLSILLDSVLTSLVSLSSRGWHLYLAAVILPLASGTGSACKGVVLDLVGPEKKNEALGGIALVEKIGQVTTIGVFAGLFGWLSDLGKPSWVFLVNAAVAFSAFLLLNLVRLQRQR